MFSQIAYTSLPEAQLQLKNFFDLQQLEKAWPAVVVQDLKNWVDWVANLADRAAWPFGDGAAKFWKEISDTWPKMALFYTNDDLSQLPNYNSVTILFGSQLDVSADIEEASGVSGVVNIATEQFTEQVEKIQKKTIPTFKKDFLKYGLGLAALFVAIKAVT